MFIGRIWHFFCSQKDFFDEMVSSKRFACFSCSLLKLEKISVAGANRAVDGFLADIDYAVFYRYVADAAEF